MALGVFLMAENLSGGGVFLDKTGGFFFHLLSQYTIYSLPTTFVVRFFWIRHGEGIGGFLAYFP